MIVRSIARILLQLQRIDSLPTAYVVPKRFATVFERHFPVEYPEHLPRATQDEINEYVWKQSLDDTSTFKVVETEQPPTPIRLIMIQRTEDHGPKGQIVTVHDPVEARNSLLLPGLAVYATEANLKKYADIITGEDKFDMTTEYVRRTIPMLRRTVVPITISCYNEWTLEPWHIHVCMRRVHLHCPIECIEIPTEPISGPNMDLQNKEFAVFVTINGKVRIPVRCCINHNDPTNKVAGWQHQFKEPVLESQRALLADMPRFQFGYAASSYRHNAAHLEQYREWRRSRNEQMRANANNLPYPIQFVANTGC